MVLAADQTLQTAVRSDGGHFDWASATATGVVESHQTSCCTARVPQWVPQCQQHEGAL